MTVTKHIARLSKMVLAGVMMMSSAIVTVPAYAQDEAGVSYASVIMYHRFGEGRYPSTNTTIEQLDSHIAYLQEGDFTVMALPEIVERFQSGQTVPDKTVAITIDDAYLSVFETGWPRFEEAGFPITLFVATGPIDRGLRGYMSWDQIRALQAKGVTIGSQTNSHPHMHRISMEAVKDELSLSNERFLAEIGLRPELFAYPYGEYNLAVIEAVKEAGFIAAFGQNSGIMHKDDLFFELPRFAFNETYGDLNRLALAANGLPLKVSQITPADMVISQNPPFYGFTLSEDMEPKNQLRCFNARYGKLDVSLLGQRAEIRLPGPLDGPRFRINCTMPGKDQRWRWFGRQFLTR
ncbi:MAG: polysaccharide deacetylase family protein [Candidatus Puniceispirillaceae bacterium]